MAQEISDGLCHGDLNQPHLFKLLVIGLINYSNDRPCRLCHNM